MAIAENQKDKFIQNLHEIRSIVQKLQSANRELKRENMRMKVKLEDMQSEQSDIFSDIAESERMAMQHQIAGLIEKIDQHLKE